MNRNLVRRTFLLVTLTAVLFLRTAKGQVGHDANHCVQRWGRPAAGSVGTNGYGSLRFAAENLAVEVEFVGGKAERVTYRSSSLDDNAVSRMLGWNVDDSEWHPWVTPGRKPAEDEPRQWIRFDEGAMARLSDGALTVTGSGWYRHLASPPTPAGTNAPPPAGESHADQVAARPAESDGIVGLWRSDSPGCATVVLQARDHGEGTWIVLGTDARQDRPIRWTRQSKGEHTVFILRDDDDVSPDGGQMTIGSVRPVPAENTMLFRAGEAFPNTLAHLRACSTNADIAFHRIASMPSWKPAAPAGLPAKGDSREKAIRILGKPTGTMQSGAREVLVYRWGNVWIVDDAVAAIEQE